MPVEPESLKSWEPRAPADWRGGSAGEGDCAWMDWSVKRAREKIVGRSLAGVIFLFAGFRLQNAAGLCRWKFGEFAKDGARFGEVEFN
jgi:hypothetical protein